MVKAVKRLLRTVYGHLNNETEWNGTRNWALVFFRSSYKPILYWKLNGNLDRTTMPRVFNKIVFSHCKDTSVINPRIINKMKQ